MKLMLVKNLDLQADAISLGIEALIPEIAVKQVSGCREAIELLKSDSDYQCIVAEDKFGDGTDVIELFKYVSAAISAIPFILISNTTAERIPYFASHPPYSVLIRPIDVASLVSVIQTALKQAPSALDSGYAKVPIKNLMLLGSTLEMDLYVKITDNKYVMVEKTDGAVATADFTKYLMRQVFFLYVKKEDFCSFINRWLTSIRNSTQPIGDELDLSQLTDRISSSLTIVNKALSFHEYTEELAQLTDASVRLAIKTIQSNKKLSEMMKAINFEEIPYIGAHSTALALVACRLAIIMDWATSATFYKLALAAFLHDISLEEDLWAKLESKNDILESGLDPELQQRILNHPMQSSAFVAKESEIPTEVEVIIRQHHERADGSGFPNSLSTNEITALSALFIFAHDIVGNIMRSGGRFDIKSYFLNPELAKRYDRGSLGLLYRTVKTQVNLGHDI